MKKLLFFLLNCVKLSIKVWIGHIIIAIILLPIEIVIWLYVIKLLDNFMIF